jgi:hypothetical protein
MVSKWYPMFCDMGYPQLDIVRYEDGEWAIIEYDNAPLLPSLTKFRHVLSKLRNVEITEGFVRNYVKQIDPRHRQFWDRENSATERMESEKLAQENHAHDLAEAAMKGLAKNEALKERIARNGIQEMSLERIARNIPTSQLRELVKR